VDCDRFNICMYTPSAYGGHARCTYDVHSAWSEMGRNTGVGVSLVTSRDLQPSNRTSPYPIYDILPPLAPRSAFRSTPQWGMSRVSHYLRRERAFLSWLEEDAPCRVIHFQEYTPWLAPRRFRLFVILQAVNPSSVRLLGLGCLIAWLAGVCFTTSYLSLLPLRFSLGVFSWDLNVGVRRCASTLALRGVGSYLSRKVQT
jgi:hypothetical protein